jgi:hypothetical protein
MSTDLIVATDHNDEFEINAHINDTETDML